VTFEWEDAAGPLSGAIGTMRRVTVGEASPFGLHGSLAE
jgi:hypothetical protein